MKKILINENPWQTRIAITHNDELQNIFFWSPNKESLERSFFKGLIIKVLPGIQTAFIDIGQERAGFLHISEIDKELAINKMADRGQIDLSEIEVEKKHDSHTKPDISKILKEGETILVQVSKEPIYEKGAKLTTCFTLPGRFLVLMPNVPRIGISKKIESREERQKLKDLIQSNLPPGMGAIIRTTSEDHAHQEILQDLNYLIQTWNTIQDRFKHAQEKEKIYQDIDLPLQVIRDHLDKDVEAVICDSEDSQNKVYKFVKHIAPEYTYKIKFYQGPPSLFESYKIERQIEQALEKKVYLKSGGSIIIETTEAMTVVDVNTGRFIGQSNLEDTILKTNLEAAEEITRQLKLRNIGGLIVIDFIDMANTTNKQKLFRFFEKMLKERDKFQSVVLKISEFGLVQMTRKRSGKTLIQELMNTCETCHGLGFTKSVQNESVTVLRKLEEYLESKKPSDLVSLTLHPDVFNFLTTHEYNSILYLERTYKCKITLGSKEQIKIDTFKIDNLWQTTGKEKK